MNQKQFVPDRGDIVWLSMDPQQGREIRGIRPVLVLSPKRYNRKVGLAIVCPITSKRKGYAFEVEIPKGLAVEGVVLADHVKSLDLQARRARWACEMPEEKLLQVVGKLQAIIGAG